MKKFIIAAAVLLASVGSAMAVSGQVSVPSANTNQAAPIGYGGTKYATSTFSSEFTTACAPCTGVVYGVIFSSGLATHTEFVDIWDSTTVLNTGGATGNARMRIYNLSNSTSTQLGAGFNGPTYPVRFSRGIIFKPGVATFNSIMLQYWAEE